MRVVRVKYISFYFICRFYFNNWICINNYFKKRHFVCGNIVCDSIKMTSQNKTHLHKLKEHWNKILVIKSTLWNICYMFPSIFLTLYKNKTKNMFMSLLNCSLSYHEYTRFHLGFIQCLPCTPGETLTSAHVLGCWWSKVAEEPLSSWLMQACNVFRTLRSAGIK